MISKKIQDEHIEDSNICTTSTSDGVAADEILINAQNHVDDEHSLTFRQAFRLYRSGIIWAVVMSASIIMEGYDTSLILSFFAYPSFAEKFGKDIGGGNYELSGSWQVALSAGSSVGTIIGILINGYASEKFGHRYVALVSYIFMTAFIFILFFAQTVSHLLVGQILCGLPWGVFATLGASYSSEILPVSLRGYLTAYINLCFVIGQFIAAGVLQALIGNKTEWSFRIPLAIQWAFIPFLFIATIYAPDSPQWLVRKGRIDEAVKNAKRLSAKAIHSRAHERVAFMSRTNELEIQQQQESGGEYSGIKGYLKCFQGTNLRRTEIACIAFAGQVLSGSTFGNSPSYFFLQSGLNPDDVYKLNLGVTAVAFTFCVLSWFLLNRFGRRQIYITGYSVLNFTLLLVGILSAASQSTGSQWAQAGLIMFWVATYSLSIGPLAFTISSEMSATRVRHQSISLARGFYSITNLISQIVEPYLINPSEANLKGKTAFVWFGTGFCILVWAFFRLPETKDRTYEELDILFEERVSSRKFAGYNLNSGIELIEDQQVMK